MPVSTENCEMTREFRKSFSGYIKRKRRRLQVSQKKFAELLGVNPRYIWNLEQASHLPSRQMAQQIGEYFDEPQTALLAAGYLPFSGWWVNHVTQ